MKKTGLLFVSILLLVSHERVWGDQGCDGYHVYHCIKVKSSTVDENSLTTSSYNLDLNDSEEYRKYKGKIRDVEIDYVRYSITSNTGGGGQADLYANVYGGSFATATKVAGPISFAAGELRGVTDVAMAE